MLESLKNKKAFICDMDGVLYHGNKLLDGATKFIEWLQAENKKYLFLTNSSERSPRELQQKLERLGVSVGEEHFYTSAIATAKFLATQHPGCTVYAIGEAGLINALYQVGITMNDVNPDYVVVGDTRSYGYEKIEKAVRLVFNGAKLIGTNPDVTSPMDSGIVPATKALLSPIELTTRKTAYCIGKPNPLMMRHAVKLLDENVEDTAIVGDRMDTDIVAGIESEIDTILVLSGVTTISGMEKFAYRPKYVFDNVGKIVD